MGERHSDVAQIVRLAAQAGVTVFHVAFANWVADDHLAAFQQFMDEALVELRALTSG